MYTIQSNGIKFDIKKTRKEIKFIDERGDTLTWERTAYNEYLVQCFVEDLTGELYN